MARLRDGTLRERQWFEEEPYGAFWERGYRDLRLSTMGGPSHEIVEVLPALPPGAKVLDLGCGEGRNSLFLAQKGFDVTAIDRSAAGINKLKTMAGRAGVALRPIVADIATIDLDEDYDLVMAHGVLYYLTNDEWRELLLQVKDRTRPGGFNIYTIFIFDQEYPRPHEFKSARYTGSFSPGELKEFYRGWEVIRDDRYVKWDQHPGIPLHYHPIEKLVARKITAKTAEAIIRSVPIGSVSMPNDRFDAIAMGWSEKDLLAACGPPDVVDTVVHADGLQFGAASVTVDCYELRLLYYGRTVLYLVNNQVWGKAIYSSHPTRVVLERSIQPPLNEGPVQTGLQGPAQA